MNHLWRHGRPPVTRLEHPVVLVSCHDAQAHCRWRGCSLPSEAQWEKAARGDEGRYFPWGNDWDPSRANISRRLGGTSPVRGHPEGGSPYGILDSAGNVFEWTATAFSKTKATLKGCSWDDAAGICRSASRHGRNHTARHILFGFRCACADRQMSIRSPSPMR